MLNARFFQPTVKDVAFGELRHNDLPCYLAEGYGGRPIESWPVFSFFDKYLQGRVAEATEAFANWYEEQFEKYCGTPKNIGGMSNGSLYRLIERVHEANGQLFAGDLNSADQDLLKQAIRLRVRQRFELVNAIAGEGYHNDESDAIKAVRAGGLVYLKGGHHRSAVLRLLGRTHVPDVQVFASPRRFQRAIRKGVA